MSLRLRFYIPLIIVFILIGISFSFVFSIEGVKEYLLEDSETVIYLTVRQLEIFFSSASFGIVVSVLIGFCVSQPPLYRYSNYVMQLLNVTMAVPTLAVLAITMLVFDIGFFSAWLALVLITLMPIARNTFNAFVSVDQDQINVAKGMGMSKWEILFQVKLPQALPLIFAGIRSGIIFNIGSLPLIFLIGAEGLGELIFIGLRLNDISLVIIGSVLTALMAIIVDIFIHVISYLTISKGILHIS